MLYILTPYHLHIRRFRPLAGFWFLNKQRNPQNCLKQSCFRPLAGFWFLNDVYQIVIKHAPASFRPLAGFWFLNEGDFAVQNAQWLRFPSPCGVLVLKLFSVSS